MGKNRWQKNYEKYKSLIHYEFSCAYCGKVFEGSRSKFDECFEHQNKEHPQESVAHPCYPINHCLILEDNKTYQYLP